jgi:ketosteroid isomerase-like protein
MRTPLLVALLAYGLWVPAAVAQQPSSTAAPSPGLPKWSAAERAVWAQEEAYWRFVKVHDRQAFLKLWDERFAGWPRIEVAPVHKDGLWANPIITTRKILAYKLEPLSVRKYGDDVVITLYRATIHSTNENGGDEQTLSSRLMHSWMKTAQGWQIIGGMSAQDGPGPQLSQTQSGANLEEEIARIDDDRRNAYLRNDAATLDRILADDVTAVAGIGTEGDKASILADVGSHRLQYKKFNYDRRKIRIYDETAVVTSYVEVGANYKERDLSGKLLGTRVYAKQRGTWKLVAIQSTKIPQEVSAISHSQAEAELRAAMDERRTAFLVGDVVKVASLMADEYLQTDIEGRVQDKTTWLNEYMKPLAALIKAGTARWDVYEQKDLNFRFYNDCAVVTGSLDLKISGARVDYRLHWIADPNYHGKERTLRFTRVYVKRDGHWLLADIHNAIPVPPPAASN